MVTTLFKDTFLGAYRRDWTIEGSAKRVLNFTEIHRLLLSITDVSGLEPVRPVTTHRWDEDSLSCYCSLPIKNLGRVHYSQPEKRLFHRPDVFVCISTEDEFDEELVAALIVNELGLRKARIEIGS